MPGMDLGCWEPPDSLVGTISGGQKPVAQPIGVESGMY